MNRDPEGSINGQRTMTIGFKGLDRILIRQEDIQRLRVASVAMVRSWPLTPCRLVVLRAGGCIGFRAVAELVRCTDREISDQIGRKLRRSSATARGFCTDAAERIFFVRSSGPTSWTFLT